MNGPCLANYTLVLFLIEKNDLFRRSIKLTPIMFADDTNLFISDSNIENLFEIMNEELRKVDKIYQIFYLHCT